jgi:uracil-DNA glycosylase
MPKEVDIEPEWKEVLGEFFGSEKFLSLSEFVRSEYQTTTVYPLPKNMFNAFWLTPFSKVKVVILGQDPYHGAGQAHGLSFSVPEGVRPPPSLQNIYKEIETDIGVKKDFTNGNLEAWAKQGVFLLNAILTVKASSPASHQKKGWEEFTDFVIKTLSDKRDNLVFLLWGNFARSKKSLINTSKHLVLEAAHPSPFSAYNGFFGCKHFSKTNEFLKQNSLQEISW